MSAVPKTVVVPLFSVEKLTVPVLVAVTVAVNVTLAPTLTFVAEGEIVVVEATREAFHAEKRVLKLIDPSPVTRS
jgi:hypothetical protein